MFLVLVFLLAYWPGPPATPTDAAPTYDRRIPVVTTLPHVRANLREALREWNACPSRLHLYLSSVVPGTSGTITVLPGERGDWPRGGWVGDHGVLLLPPGSWERSVPVIRHELGHALGFGHAPPHTLSVMSGSNHVQPVDCRGLRYYD